MDLPSLALIVGAAACSPNPDEHRAAEQSLNQFQHTLQHLVRILQIIVDGGSDVSIRQAASIHFKNFIAKHWEPHSGDHTKVLPCDKSVIRDQILVYVSQVPPILRYVSSCLRIHLHKLDQNLKITCKLSHHGLHNRMIKKEEDDDAELRTE